MLIHTGYVFGDHDVGQIRGDLLPGRVAQAQGKQGLTRRGRLSLGCTSREGRVRICIEPR